MSVQLIGTENGILAAKIRGILTHAELVSLQQAAAEVIQREGSVRLLVVAEDFQGWAKEGDWQDVSFQLEHDEAVGKMAIVGDKQWEGLALLFVDKRFRRFPIEYFAPADLDQARAWLREE